MRFSFFKSWKAEQMSHVEKGDYPILVLPYLFSVWKSQRREKTYNEHLQEMDDGHD